MAREQTPEYPPSAYAPNGELWWRLRRDPEADRPFGDERKIAAWLAFNVCEGDTFTMRDIRRELGVDDAPNTAEHLNRRLRSLRHDGWIVYSYRDDGTLPVDTYRLGKSGWHPGTGARRPQKQGISAGVRRRVFQRDGRRCVVCFVAAGEPYPGEPGSAAVMTIGHRVPGVRSTRAATEDELQTECQRCNETVRDELPDPLTIAEVLPEVKRLKRADRESLLRWLDAGRRVRSHLDDAYDQVRALTPAERLRVRIELKRMVGRS